MAVVRLSGGLPPDLEAELYRETSGETVLWAGRASGLVERIHGYTVAGVGGVIALFNLGGPLGLVGLALDLVRHGRMPGGGFGTIAFSIMAFVAGLAIARLGWRYVSSSRHVVWAVTDKRLLRLIAGGGLPTQSWTGDQITAIERLNWDEPQRRGLAVTVRGPAGRELTLVIVGPADLDRADAALRALARTSDLHSALQAAGAIA